MLISFDHLARQLGEFTQFGFNSYLNKMSHIVSQNFVCSYGWCDFSVDDRDGMF